MTTLRKSNTTTFGEGIVGYLAAKLALQLMANYRQARIDYAESCEEYRKQGFRPHYCFHGMNLWVDYDPICGPCEDGYGILGAYRDAISVAKMRAADVASGLEHLRALSAILPDLDENALQFELWKLLEA